MSTPLAAAARPRTWHLDVALFVVVLLTCIAGSGSFSLLDVDEPRFASASRSMARMEPGENWIVPHFNGAERFDKPILVYWLQATAMKALGENERAARLPSALAIALAALLTAGITRVLGARPSIAALAGLALGTCGLAVTMGHAATSDALLLACTTACARAQIGRFVRGPTLASFVLMWLAAAAAFLAKGPAAWIGPAVLGLATFAAGARPRPAALLAGTALMLVPVLAWGIPALVLSDGRFWKLGVMYHVVERGTRPFEGHGGYAPQWWLFYLGSVPLTFLPWTVLLPLCWPVVRGEVELARPNAHRVLIGWVAGVVVAFTLSASKLVHYVLPCYPALACLVALGVERAASRPRPLPILAHALRGAGWILGAATAVAIGFVVAGHELHEVALALAGLCVTFALGCLAAARLVARQALLPAAGTLGAAAALAFALLGARVMPALDQHFVARKLRHEVARLLDARAELSAYRELMPSLVYYLDRRIVQIEPDDGGSSARKALELIAAPGRYVLANAKHIDELRRALPELNGDAGVVQRASAALDHPLLDQSGILLNKGPQTRMVLLGQP